MLNRVTAYLCGMQKIGILGGGQLGRMLLQAAANYPVETYILENDADCPAAGFCHHFVLGDIRSYEDVYRFGKDLDALTIEIENVNIEALEQLEREGKCILPRPGVLRIICNKASQKEFYSQHQIPTAAYVLTRNKAELAAQEAFLPAVHKLAEGGYDGRGVQLLQEPADLELGFDTLSVLEKMIDVEKEIALMVAVARDGKIAIYPAVEMLFDRQLNQLSFQLCPAEIDQATYYKVEAIALTAVKNFEAPGLYAVELFVTKQGDVLINEIAPRVHNSGHHTIEAHFCSQFDMIWRILLDYPLGSTEAIMPSLMQNILGAEGYQGKAVYQGLKDLLAIETAFFHIYGKRQTKPGRKMGHVTIIGKTKADLLYYANKIRHNLAVVSK
ncbi:5-(carboxyamino)imidazole ribonucleotide synthase [Niabella terrae]